MMNMRTINFEEAAKVMPRRIEKDTKAMKMSTLGVSAKFALDTSKDGEGITLTIRIEDTYGNFTIVNCDPRKDRPFYSAKGRVEKETLNKAIQHCLSKLEERFPTNRQLTIDDMINNDSPALTDESIEDGTAPSKHWVRPELA